MKVKLACELKVGDTVMGTERNPNIRGTISEVKRFGCPVANKQRQRFSLPSGRQDSHGDKELSKIKSPPSPKTARQIANEVDACYDDEQGSIAVQIGSSIISLNPTAKVHVWVSYRDAYNILNGRVFE